MCLICLSPRPLSPPSQWHSQCRRSQTLFPRKVANELNCHNSQCLPDDVLCSVRLIQAWGSVVYVCMCVRTSVYRWDWVLVGGWCVNKLRVIGGGRLPGVETWRNVVLFMALGSLRVRIAAREAGGLSVRPSVCAHCGRLPGGKKNKTVRVCLLRNYSHNHNMPPLGRLYINTYSQH